MLAFGSGGMKGATAVHSQLLNSWDGSPTMADFPVCGRPGLFVEAIQLLPLPFGPHVAV